MKLNLKTFLIGGAVMMTLASCQESKTTPDGAPAPAPQPPAEVVSDIEVPDKPSEDQIVFISYGSVSSELYRMNNDGSGLSRLTRNSNTEERSPSWAPDGRTIVYSCSLRAICRSNPDGTKEETLYTSDRIIKDAVLSPDGGKLAFSANDDERNAYEDIFIVDLATRKVTNLTASKGVGDTDPVWHPLGGLAWISGVRTPDFLVVDKIMYAPGGTDDAFVITDDTSTKSKHDLDVSPDGNRYVYSAVGDTGVDIFLFDFDADTVTKLTQTTSFADDFPVFSPDGSQIAYSRKDQSSDPDTEIYKMNVDGSGVRRLTFNGGDDRHPDWGKPAAVISIGDAEGAEGDAPGDSMLEFKVSLSTVQSTQVTVNYVITPTSASANDLSTTGGKVTFAPGEKNKTIAVPLTGDIVVETNESFRVSLTAPVGGSLGDGEGRGLIINDDEAPSPTPSPTPTPTPTGSPTPAEPGVIAFSSTRNDANFDIWIMDEDGTGARALTNDPAFDGGAEVSPDGLNVIFQRGVDGPPDIYSAPTAGGTPSKINGSAAAADVTPSYKPDGTAIVWASGDGTSTKLLTASPRAAAPTVMADEPGDEAYPSWGTLSNGQSAVAFQVQNGDTDFSLRLLNLDSGVTTNLGEGRHPDISPDGTKLVYASNKTGGVDIYVRSLTNLSAAPVRLTTNANMDVTPSWSPDGTKIAYTAHPAGNSEIFVMNADGTGQKNITNNPAEDFEPSWGPSAGAAQSLEVPADVTPSPEPSPEPSPNGSYGALIPLLGSLLLATRRRHRKD